MRTCYSTLLALVCASTSSTTNGFVSITCSQTIRPTVATLLASEEYSAENVLDISSRRRSFLSSLLGTGVIIAVSPGLAAAEEEESFASIAARAAQLSSDVGDKTIAATPKSDDPRTAYDFSLPVAGETVQFRDLVRQEYDSNGRAKVKAILVVNMKEDDPIARKDIPEFISLASK